MSIIVCPTNRVQEAWIDYNGHMNMAYYHVVFDQAVDHVYDRLGIGAAYVETGFSVFTMEVHVHYLQELALDDPIEVHFRFLDHDEKRIHFFEEMYHAESGFLAATSEQLAMHVDMDGPRSSPLPTSVQAELTSLCKQHATLPTPKQVGQKMGIKRKV